MDRQFEPKPISKDGISAALEKAERYRFLADPSEAESICRDVLRIDSDHQAASVLYILSLTDQFGDGLEGRLPKACELVAGLDGEYEKAYYTGMIKERSAKAAHGRSTPHAGFMAYESLLEAMDWYEKAEALSDDDNDDAVIRWNACARMVNDHAEIRPAPAEVEPPQLLE